MLQYLLHSTDYMYFITSQPKQTFDIYNLILKIKNSLIIYFKMYNCVVCDKIFNTKRNMLRHENTHSGIRFAFEKYDVNFTYKTVHTDHVKKMHPAPNQTIYIYQNRMMYSRFRRH